MKETVQKMSFIQLPNTRKTNIWKKKEKHSEQKCHKYSTLPKVRVLHILRNFSEQDVSF